jgi:hypothetical protein
VGYIPAENIETPNERLARLNRRLNLETAAACKNDEEIVERNKISRHITFDNEHEEMYPEEYDIETLERAETEGLGLETDGVLETVDQVKAVDQLKAVVDYIENVNVVNSAVNVDSIEQPSTTPQLHSHSKYNTNDIEPNKPKKSFFKKLFVGITKGKSYDSPKLEISDGKTFVTSVTFMLIVRLKIKRFHHLHRVL